MLLLLEKYFWENVFDIEHSCDLIHRAI